MVTKQKRDLGQAFRLHSTRPLEFPRPSPDYPQKTNTRTRTPTARKDREGSMVIGLLVIAGIPTTIGVCEALSAQKKANNAAKEKAKFHLTASVSLDGEEMVECWIVLKEGRVSRVFHCPFQPQ